MVTRSVILVVEDEPVLRRFVVQLLRREGYEVALAEDGAEALDLAFERTPHLVLLDLMIPKVDGFEVCRRLRDRPETARVPILVVSARDTDEARRHCREAGADDFIAKPFTVSELMARVEEALGGSRV